MMKYIIERIITRRAYDYWQMEEAEFITGWSYFDDMRDDPDGGFWTEEKERVFYGADEETVRRILTCKCTSIERDGDTVTVTRRRHIYPTELRWLQDRARPVSEVVFRIRPMSQP